MRKGKNKILVIIRSYNKYDKRPLAFESGSFLYAEKEQMFEKSVDKQKRMFYYYKSKREKTYPHHTNGVGAPLIMDRS